MTTRSVVSALPAAARMRCSSCGRFTSVKFANDREPLLGSEDAAEGTRLPQAGGAFVGRFEEREQLVEWAGEHALPFEQVGPGAWRNGFQPAGEIAAGLLGQRRLAPQFRRDEAVEGQAARVDEAVIFHAAAKVAERRGGDKRAVVGRLCQTPQRGADAN